MHGDCSLRLKRMSVSSGVRAEGAIREVLISPVEINAQESFLKAQDAKTLS